MKYLYTLFFIFTVLTQLKAQVLGDPFNWTEPVTVEANDIFLLWNENVAGTYKSFQKVYRYKIDSTGLAVDSMISKTPRQEDPRTSSAASVHMDIATGRFNADQYDDIVAAWYSLSGIEIMIPQFDTTKAMWTASVQQNIDTGLHNRFYVRTGDFDADSLDEFVVAYVDAEDSIHINLYDVDSSLNATLIAEICDENLAAPFSWENISYYLESGDLNGDGRDEIILQFKLGTVTQTSWNIYTKIYEYNGSTIVAKARTIIQSKPGPTAIEVTMAICSGQFKDDPKDELAYVAIFKTSSTSYAYILLLEASSDLQQINFDFNKRFVRSFPNPVSSSNQLSFASGDLNNDNRDEVVFSTGDNILVQSTDDNLNPYAKVQGGIAEGRSNDYRQSFNFLKIADVNQDFREDIVITKNLVNIAYQDGFFVAMITANEALDTLRLLGRNLGDESQYDQYQSYAIAIGNFDGYYFTIGQPTHQVQTDWVQPVVTLNAPPVHFDKFDTDLFDVSGCYNGGNCNFSSTYTAVSQSSNEVSTEIHKDWGISGGLYTAGTVSASLMGVGVDSNYEFYLLGKHGKQFSQVSTNISTITVNVSVDAIEDDWIFTTITDYDIWEYPVYHGNEKDPRRTFLAMVPKNPRGAWYPSKSWNVFTYIPDHQISNILSYQEYDSLNNNSQLQQPIRMNFGNESFLLNTSSSIDREVSIQDFRSSEADTVKEIGIDFKAQAAISLYQADYTSTEMSTHKVSVIEGISLRTHLGAVNSFQGYGETGYHVTPYAYWGTSGAVVMNFAASPPIALLGGLPTFWQQKYGTYSDPTFILPWILDPEKGFGISEEAKRYQTKDIIFDPVDPLPGDTLTITARVRNFSLLPTPAPVSVTFFVDDPDSGGVPLIGLNGTNNVSTSGPIQPRQRADVEFQLMLPAGLPSYPRIYAVLDQPDIIQEIHSVNNKGF